MGLGPAMLKKAPPKENSTTAAAPTQQTSNPIFPVKLKSSKDREEASGAKTTKT